MGVRRKRREGEGEASGDVLCDRTARTAGWISDGVIAVKATGLDVAQSQSSFLRVACETDRRCEEGRGWMLLLLRGDVGMVMCFVVDWFNMMKGLLLLLAESKLEEPSLNKEIRTCIHCMYVYTHAPKKQEKCLAAVV